MRNERKTAPGRCASFWRVHDKILDVSAVGFLCGVLLFMGLQIVTRYVFNSPLKWTEEVTRNCAVWLTFVGGVITVREGANICIDAIINLFPPTIRKAAWIITTVLCLVFFAVLAYYGCRFVAMNLRIRSLVTGFNMGLLYSVIPASAVLMAVNMVRKVKETPEWKY